MRKKLVVNINFERLPLISIGEPNQVSGSRYSADRSFTDTGWHCHNVGVLGFLETGLVAIKTEQESMVISAGMMIFIPANTPHLEQGMGTEMEGWFVCLPQNKIEFMPQKPCVLEASELFMNLCKRIISWGTTTVKTAAHDRLILTFLDELENSNEAKYLSIPLPATPGLLLVAKRIMSEPEDMNQINHWSKIAGMSRRSFTRYFSEETGLSFALWRQRVKLYSALQRLSEDTTVTEVALDLGYQNASTFIAVFRKQFGSTPTEYIRKSKSLRR